MAAHAARDHAQWSASATERNWKCPGALALTDSLPERTSPAADWGTCAHEIAEISLREDRTPIEFIGTKRKGKEHEFEVDEEMADTAGEFVDYVRSRVAKAASSSPSAEPVLQIEQHFTLDDLRPPFEAGGTADAVVYFPSEQELEVIDLKGGRGHVVEVEGNPQLRTYALGAMLANRSLAVGTVKVTIVQPRAPHKSGRIRSETFHVADLLEWTTDLLAAMHRAKAAADARSSSVAAAWSLEHLNAGDHCKFCKAAGTCPALQKKAYDAAGLWFDDLDQPRLANSPDAMSPEALAEALDATDMIEDWINAVRSFAHSQAESGVTIPNYQLVDKIGTRKWSADENSIVSELKALGVVDPYNHKLVSPAQAEKLLGSKKKGEIKSLVQRSVTGTNLVRADKTTRPAVPSSAEKHFNILD